MTDGYRTVAVRNSPSLGSSHKDILKWIANSVTIKHKYRKERDENEKLRALLVAQAAKTRQTQQQLQPIIETNIEPKYNEAIQGKLFIITIVYRGDFYVVNIYSVPSEIFVTNEFHRCYTVNFFNMELRNESELIFKKARNNINRAENIIREQEKIIKKLEDLLQRSMDTVDKRKWNLCSIRVLFSIPDFLSSLTRAKHVNLTLNTACRSLSLNMFC